MILLTQQERDKFILWLEQEAQSDNVMVEQAMKLKGGEIIAKHMKQRVALFSIMAMELRKIENMSL